MTRLKEGILYNEDDCLTLSGDRVMEGSRCFGIDEDTGFSEVQIIEGGILQPGPFQVGPNTLWLGQTGVGSSGHHLTTELSDSHLHFHVHSEFVDGVSTTDAQVINAPVYMENIPIQPDDSVDWEGTELGFVMTPGGHALLDILSVKTGSLAASKYVRLTVWQNNVPVGKPIFDQKYPASDFTADIQVQLTLAGNIEFEADTDFFFKYYSSEPFSLKANAELTLPWAMISYSVIKENRLLQTAQWESGDTFEDGQYLITNRKIYLPNIPGEQVGTFEINTEKWNELSPFIFSWEKLPIYQNLLIPENHQMAVFGTFTMDGDVNLDGTLVLRN